MSVGRGSARRSIFVFREKLAHLAGNLLPFARWLRMEDIRQRSPPAVARQDGLLRVGGVPFIGINLFKRADSFEVGEGFFPETAFTDPVRFSYPEVTGRRGWRVVGVELAEDDSGRSWLGRNAHSLIAISQAAW